MNKNFLLALPLAATLALPAVAQQTSNPQDNQQGQIQTGISSQPSQTASGQDELGARQPLQQETRQGFWGKLNPFARKKYVERQLSPIRNRVNELDELTAGNTRMLKDVDSRATEGIRNATNKANEADQHAQQANQRAVQAHETAQQASTRLQSVEQVVGKLDEYSAANQAELKFRAGQTSLTKTQKEELDEMVANAANQRGYIIQVQGFSPGKGQAAIQSSQAMAQAVARYLVIEHQIPVYRIYVVGLGNAPVQTAEGKAQRVRGGRVEVTLLKNGVEQLSANASAGQSQAAPMQGGATYAPAQQNGNAGQQGAIGNSTAAPWQRPAQQQGQPQQQPEPINPR